MSKKQLKHHDAKHGGKVPFSKKTDILFYALAAAAVVLVLFFLPRLLAETGVSFLSSGSGLNKLASVVVAALLGWVCFMPSLGYKNFIDLAKGARIEWKKTVKPDRDTVLRTTMMVILLVVFFAILILILDWGFGSILRSIVS